MNPFVLTLMVFEAIIALGGLAFLVYSFVAGYPIIGPLIGIFTFVIFGLFTYGTYQQAREGNKKA